MARLTGPEGRTWLVAFLKSGHRLEVVVYTTLAHAEVNLASALATLHCLKGDVNEQVATPLVHALWIAGGSFNYFSFNLNAARDSQRA